MDVAADALFLAAHHQRDLTVCFQPQQAVDNVAAGFFQHLRPENIVFLVKTGFQLNQDRHLFSIVRRFSERRDNRGVTADTVEGLLDRQHLRVAGSFLDKIDDRLKGLKRVGQQYIAFADIGKNIILIHQRRNRLRRVRRCLKFVKARQTEHLHENRQIKRSVNLIDRVPADVQLLFEDV